MYHAFSDNTHIRFSKSEFNTVRCDDPDGVPVEDGLLDLVDRTLSENSTVGIVVASKRLKKHLEESGELTSKDETNFYVRKDRKYVYYIYPSLLS